MRIRRLDITGFKSFMDRAVFTFDEGVTGVAGPHGCGTWHVVDAIRWVMGSRAPEPARPGWRTSSSTAARPAAAVDGRGVAHLRGGPHAKLAPQYPGFRE
jgi:chromosome segregation protein